MPVGLSTLGGGTRRTFTLSSLSKVREAEARLGLERHGTPVTLVRGCSGERPFQWSFLPESGITLMFVITSVCFIGFIYYSRLWGGPLGDACCQAQQPVSRISFC